MLHLLPNCQITFCPLPRLTPCIRQCSCRHSSPPCWLSCCPNPIGYCTGPWKAGGPDWVIAHQHDHVLGATESNSPLDPKTWHRHRALAHRSDCAPSSRIFPVRSGGDCAVVERDTGIRTGRGWGPGRGRWGPRRSVVRERSWKVGTGSRWGPEWVSEMFLHE